MRMIGLGLCAFLLAGLAMIFPGNAVLDQSRAMLRTVTGHADLSFRGMNLSADKNAATEVIIPRATPQHPLILSGLPAYGRAVFQLPIDARATSGRLTIKAGFQILEGVEGVLRISIDNAKRGEILLRPGWYEQSIEIPLSVQDLAHSSLAVSFSLQGQGPHSACSIDAGVEAIVDVDAGTTLALTLDRPIETPRDRVASWGGQVHLDTRTSAIAAQLAKAAMLSQRDVPIRFVETAAGLTPTQVSAIMPQLPAQENLSWPRLVARQGPNAGIRRFHRTTTWRIRYDLNARDQLRFAGHFDLDLAVPGFVQEGDWRVTVTLNDRLVHQAVVARGAQRYAADIALPEAHQDAINAIEVTLNTTHPSEGMCAQGPEYVAEMLPSSRLVAGEGNLIDAVAALTQKLDALSVIHVATLSDPGPVDAAHAAALLANVMPLGARPVPQIGRAEIWVVLPGADDQWPDQLPDGTVLVQKNAQSGKIELLPATPKNVTSVALLIAPSGIDITGVRG